MTFRALAGGGAACAYCGFCLVMEGPRQCCLAGRDYDAKCDELERLQARLDEISKVIRSGLSHADQRRVIAELLEAATSADAALAAKEGK